MYKLNPTHPVFGEAKSLTRLSDGASIPFDPANTDYQTYLKWVEEGGVPLPANEETQ
jgi:hypothetical protein